MRNIAITVDAVIFSKIEADYYILLIQRKNKPFLNQWALPGGFVDHNELVIAACIRELKEETGLVVRKDSIEFVGIFDQLNRDPRGRTISVAYGAILDYSLDVKAGDDAKEAMWFNLNEINAELLAFDHYLIIKRAATVLGIL